MTLRRIERQTPLAEITERGAVDAAAVCGSYSAHAGVLSDTMAMSFRWAIDWPGGWAAMVMFSDKVSVPAHVLVRFLDKEAVLLNIETERYFGLDETGAR